MDSSPPRYPNLQTNFAHAQSSPNLFNSYRPQTRHENSSSEAGESSSPFQPSLRRGISDSLQPGSSRHFPSNQRSTSGPVGGGGGNFGTGGTSETWMDFLKDTGSGLPFGIDEYNFAMRGAGPPRPSNEFGFGNSEQEGERIRTGFTPSLGDEIDLTGLDEGNLNLPTRFGGSNDPRGLHSGSGPGFTEGITSGARHASPRVSRFPSMPSGTSVAPSTTTRQFLAADRERDRKRRLTDTTPSGREGGASFNTGFASSSGNGGGRSGTPAGMPGPAIIDLTSSPEGPRRNSSGRRPSGGPRRTSSSGLTAGTAGLRMDTDARAGNGARQNESQEEESRRPSDIVLPRWQPDSEVTKCPVCGNTFGFFYRKHHCRKCGRVVCANCSPHRITIPRQFIVQPPAVIDLTDDMDGSPSRTSIYANPALGGGAEVRVCNPCVPDPNFSPPPQQQLPPGYEPSPMMNFMQNDPLWEASPDPQSALQNQHQNQNPFIQQPWPPSAVPPPPQPTGDVFRNRRVSFNNPSSAADLWPPPIPQPPQAPREAQRQANAAARLAGRPPPPPPPNFLGPPDFSNGLIAPRTSSRGHRPHHSSDTTGPHQPRYRSLLDPLPPDPPFSAPPLPIPPRGIHQPLPLPPSRPPQRQPRREIPEEDECPVCSMELPPKGPNGDTKDRERHVEECIASHFVGSASSSSNPRPAVPTASASRPAEPRPRPRGPTLSVPTGASASSAPPASLPFAGPHTAGRVRAESSVAAATAAASAGEEPQPRRRRATGNRMLIYTATEKDCVGEDGEAAECIICFEEFETGVELGRLECLCKFHRTCIRQWWDTKGVGSCPTHQLHD